MLNTVSKFGGVRNGASICGCPVVNRFLSFTTTVRKSAGGDDNSDNARGDDSDGAKNVNLRIIFDASADEDSSSANNEDVQSSPRLRMIFEKSVDVLGLTRYKNFPLPGHVTFGEQYRKLIVPSHSKTYAAGEQLSDKGMEDEQRRQIETVRQFGALNRYRRKAHDETTTTQQALLCLDKVYCTAHECPVLVRKDFVDTFPDSNIKNEQNLTVITITEKPSTSSSSNVDSLKSSKIQDDYESSTYFDDYSNSIYSSPSTFSNIAEEICNFIRASGFWADFVDPFSGKLFSGDFAAPTDAAGTELALSRFSGLSVESAGSCKIISRLPHLPSSSSSAAVVGVVFTSATVDSPVLKFLLDFVASNNAKNTSHYNETSKDVKLDDETAAVASSHDLSDGGNQKRTCALKTVNKLLR